LDSVGVVTEAVSSLKAIELVLKTMNDSVLVSILISVLFTIYIAFMVSRIINIKHKHTADFMEKAEDVLYSIESSSELAFFGIWSSATDYHNNDDCKTCIHPLGSFYGTLHNSLFIGTLQRIKTARHKNGFYRMSEEEYIKYLRDLGRRLRNKSQYDMKKMSKGLGLLIEKTNDMRFSEEDGISKLREIMDEAKILHKKETKEIFKTIFFFLNFKRWF